MKHLAASVLLSLSIWMPHVARAAETPEEVVRSYFEKLKAGETAASCEHFAPSAVAEIAGLIDLMAEAAEESGEAAELRQFFGEGTTPEALKKMKPMEKVKEFMTAVMAMVGEVKFSEFKVIGSVPEGEELCHVVVRMKMEVQGIEVEAVDVAPMQKADGKWGLLLQAEMSALVQGLRAQFGEE